MIVERIGRAARRGHPRLCVHREVPFSAPESPALCRRSEVISYWPTLFSQIEVLQHLSVFDLMRSPDRNCRRHTNGSGTRSTIN